MGVLKHHKFACDNANRLTGVTNGGGAGESYAFDAVGNRTGSHRSSSYGYSPFNKLTSTQTATYNFDANGNTVAKAEGSNFWRYVWDYENKLASASTRKQTVRYVYDALGRRVRRHIAGSKENTKFTYDGHDVVMDDNSGTLTKYQNGPGIDNKLRIQTGNDIKYILSDHLGTTDALINLDGTIVENSGYDSFGNGRPDFSTRYGFTGREYDSFTGLQYSRARWYDPYLGRFISEDPIGFKGGTNLYTYVGNVPTKFIDPLGLFPSLSFWPFNLHQRIGSNALAGRATPRDIQSINWSNVDFDKRTQDSEFAPFHAMTRPGQNIDIARAEANAFVRNKICLAREYESRGWHTDAMHQLGQAAHTLQDNNSPAHYDFQEAWPNTNWDMVWNWKHYVVESFFSGDQNVKRAEEDTQRVWDYFKGAPMPADYFTIPYQQKTCECAR